MQDDLRKKISNQNNSVSSNQINIFGDNNNISGNNINQNINKQPSVHLNDSSSIIGNDIKKAIIGLVEKNNLEKALEIIQSIPNLEKDITQSITLNLRRLKDLSMSNINHTISREQHELEINRISEAILKLLERI